MKKITIETAKVIIRVYATTTYPKVAGNKPRSQCRVLLYANENRELAEAVVAETKAAKVEKHTFRCMGEEVLFSRYTDSHFTVKKHGVTQKIKSGAWHRLLNEFRNSAEWYEVG